MWISNVGYRDKSRWQRGSARAVRERLRTDAIDGEAAEEVGQEADGVAVGEDDALEDAQAELGAKSLEVEQGAEMHVGCLVPLVGQFLRYRHVAGEGGLDARAAVAQ